MPEQIVTYDGRAALPWALRLGDRFQKVLNAVMPWHRLYKHSHSHLGSLHSETQDQCYRKPS